MVDFRSVLSDDSTNDDGFTLVEVIVAMMVFALIALGVGYSTLTTIRMSADTRARETATNLAASEIDAVRALADPFDVVDATTTRTLAGTQFTIRRDVGWVSGSDTSNDCGVGTGTLKYKRVNVQVSWPGAIGSSMSSADTIIAPKTRLNDPAYGSILVSVNGADGTGASGVSVVVTAQSGGATALPSQPAATDSDGCSFAFKVVPGTYKVAVSRPNGIDESQQTAPFRTVSVAAGGAGSAAFQYDVAASFAVTYAAGASPAPLLPSSGLTTSWFSSSGFDTVPGTPAVVKRHPFPSGYTVIAGTYVAPSESSAGCVSVDPGAWPAWSSGGKNLAAGTPSAAAAALPGQSAAVGVRLGTVVATMDGATQLRAKVVTATTADPATGNPGCSVATTLTWTAVPATGPAALALPFGAWKVEEFKNGAWSAVPPARLTVPTNAADPAVTGPVVLVDPRGLS